MGPQDVLNRFQRLLGKLVAVHEKQHALGPSGLEEAFEVAADEIGLAGTRRQLDQEATLAQFERMVEGSHGLGLVGGTVRVAPCRM